MRGVANPDEAGQDVAVDDPRGKGRLDEDL